MPLLVSIADRDQVTPPGPAARVAARAPRGEARHYPVGHFEIYTHDDARRDQVAFLARHLGAAAPTQQDRARSFLR
jgi:hypothetical protein